MRAPHLFDYAIVRAVPRPEREEFINVGVILSCPATGFLDAVIEIDEPRLLAFSPQVDLQTLRSYLTSFPAICRGGRAAGPIGQLTPRERYHWLVATRSAMIQTSCSHTGWCEDPAISLENLIQSMVRLPAR